MRRLALLAALGLLAAVAFTFVVAALAWLTGDGAGPSRFSTTASVTPRTVRPGTSVTIDASVKSASGATAVVDVEVYSLAGDRVFQQVFDDQAFAPGESRDYRVVWSVSMGTAAGPYVVKIGVFSPGWGTLYHWNDEAAVLALLR